MDRISIQTHILLGLSNFCFALGSFGPFPQDVDDDDDDEEEEEEEEDEDEEDEEDEDEDEDDYVCHSCLYLIFFAFDIWTVVLF